MYGGVDEDHFVNPLLPVTSGPPVDKDHYYGDARDEDSVSYYGRSSAVVVTLDNLANDGAATGVPGQASPEQDNVHSDVEGTTSPATASPITSTGTALATRSTAMAATTRSTAAMAMTPSTPARVRTRSRSNRAA